MSYFLEDYLMDKTTHQIRCEQWTEIINTCLNSGMRKADWCKANGINEKQFHQNF